jgi:hypothetical protein
MSKWLRFSQNFKNDVYSRFYSAKRSNVSEYAQHAALFKELDLKEENLGVFNGSWSGDGPLVHSYNPTTNRIIGSVRTVKIVFFIKSLKNFYQYCTGYTQRFTKNHATH